MLGLNVFSFLAFTVINLCAAALCKCSEQKRNRTLRILCIVLLSINLCLYAPLSLLLGGEMILPVEFSSVTCFVVPVILLVGFKKAQSWAAYSGIMAGFFYYMTMIIAGGKIYAAYQPYDVYISLVCHGTLYLCGLVGLRNQKYNPSDCYILLSGVGGIALNAYLLRPIADNGTRLFIYELMDGRYIRQVFPEVLWSYMTPVYYVLMIGLVFLSIKLFFKLNKMQYEKYMIIVDQKSKPVQTTIQALS